MVTAIVQHSTSLTRAITGPRGLARKVRSTITCGPGVQKPSLGGAIGSASTAAAIRATVAGFVIVTAWSVRSLTGFGGPS